jgi:hypothetical protein
MGCKKTATLVKVRRKSSLRKRNPNRSLKKRIMILVQSTEAKSIKSLG